MKKNKKEELKFINYRLYIIIMVILAAFLIIFNVMFRCSTAFATSFSDTVFMHVSTVISAIFSISPVPVIELLICILTGAVFFSVGRLIYLIIKYHKKNNIFRFKYRLKKTLLNYACILLACLNIYSLNCGVNCFRLSFAAGNNIIVRRHTTEDLKELADLLIEMANDYSENITTDEAGHFCMNHDEAEEIAVRSMKSLSRKYPCLKSTYFKPKPAMFSELMSVTLTLGYYSPYTLEATYNKNVRDIEIPFTLCHELAHTSGFMLEDEANYIGFLACTCSDNYNFKYSGVLGVITYVLNDLYDSVSITEYQEVISSMNAQTVSDLNYMYSYWDEYENKKAGKIANTVYEGYLTTTGQSDGLKSYGRVTDLLLACYID